VTTIRLAVSGEVTERQMRALESRYQPSPAILVSYVYIQRLLDMRGCIGFRDWVLDSGAFSAQSIGVRIDIDAFAAWCREALRVDKQLVEVFSLDVIGDWRASLRNTEYLWKLGVPAIPAYHVGEPIDVLDAMARDYPKIAFGGAVGMKKQSKLDWAAQCMRRIWPKPVHGFGFGTLAAALTIPFDSMDATNWEIGPSAFGHWQAFGKMDVRGPATHLRPEIDVILGWERQATDRWAEMAPEIEPDLARYRAAIEEART